MKKRAPWWKPWLRLSRLLPLATVATGIIVGILSVVGIIPNVTFTEGVMLVVITLLAADNVVERVNILENIEGKLENMHGGEALIERELLPDLRKEGERAKEICLVVIAGHMLTNHYRAFFEQKLKTGCRFRIILVNPNNAEAIDMLSRLDKGDNAYANINSALAIWHDLYKKGTCEIRLIDVPLPFSLVGVDLSKNGYLTVEFHTYKVAFASRPSVVLRANEDSRWFDFYNEQFEVAWENAIQYLQN